MRPQPGVANRVEFVVADVARARRFSGGSIWCDAEQSN
jgi:hypothetical protein